MLRYCLNFHYHWIILLLASLLSTTGCSAKTRSNTSEFRAGYVDSQTGVPVWVEQVQEWNSSLKSTASKTALENIGAKEVRTPDGGLIYEVNANGVSTSPELKTLDRMLDMADRIAMRYGPGPLSASPPQTNSLPTQIVLTPEQYEQFLMGRASGVNDMGEALERPRSLPAVDRVASPDVKVGENFGAEDAQLGTESGETHASPAPTLSLQLTPEQFDLLENLLGQPDETPVPNADRDTNGSEADDALPPANPIEG